MGSSCGISAKKEEIDQVSIPEKNKRIFKSDPPPNEQLAKIGAFYAPCISNLPQMNEWKSIIFEQESSFIPKTTKFRKRLKILASHGIPTEYRWRVWCNLLIKEKLMTENQYTKIPLAPDYHTASISRDLDRSFPFEPYFDKSQYGSTGQAALQRVLSKFASIFPEIGYCQGMNFIVGFLLLVSGGSEIEVFHFLVSLFNTFSLENFFSEGLEKLKQYVWVSKKILEKSNPKLFKHLTEQNIPDDLWLLKWIMTLFTMILPDSVLVRIWDMMLLKGINYLFSVIVAVCSVIEDEVLSRDTGEICVFLSDIRVRIKDSEEVCKAIKGVKIRKEKIEELMEEYWESFKQSPCKDKMLTTGEDFKLPPLRLSPCKMNYSNTPSPIKMFYSRPGSPLLSPCVERNSISPSSPAHPKKTKVPVLPNIQRKSIRRRSFGLTNKSCELKINCEHSY